MSISVQQILCDAKRLVNQLKEHDNQAEKVISQAQDLSRHVTMMREYNEDLNGELNGPPVPAKGAKNSRAALIMSIQQENRQMRQLQRENDELREALEEHQNTMDLIMDKYRSQVLELTANRKLERELIEKFSRAEDAAYMADKINEMAAVMQKAIQIDDEAVHDELQKITRYQHENRVLRELLEISRNSGSLSRGLIQPEKVDAETSTDPPPDAPES